MKLLEVRSLSKSFGDHPVLRNISLEVEKGEVVAIIGPSGSGKSTLLRCCTMLEQADGGSIVYGGKALMTTGADGRVVWASKQEQKAIRSCFGLVFQSFHLFPHFNVLRNITEAPIHVGKVDREQARNQAMALLRKMGLEDRADAMPGQLSGGQQQRVSIARALALDPEILFFDEPTSALDPELTGEILKVIRDLAKEKMTMVVVTHEMAFARDVADRIVFMDKGVIEEEGPAQELINHPKNERTRAFLSRFSGN